MRRIQLVALFAVFSFAMASIAVAAGPKGPRPAKANVHTPKGSVPKGTGQSAKRTAGKAHAGKKSTDTAANASESARPDKADRADRSDKADKSIAGNIEKNPQLESRIKSMLPADMTIAQASEGFRNQGQFIAAVNASKNQTIPFADLKTEMTGDSALSLGQAIQKLRPGTDTDPD